MSSRKPDMTTDERIQASAKLLENIRRQDTSLGHLLSLVEGEWAEEDAVYRFYHQSFKVYHLQQHTERIVEALRSLLPERPLDDWFVSIVNEGTGRKFEADHNHDWPRHARPILEAFWHAKYMLRQAVTYATLAEAPTLLPSGWAALLYLYRLR